MDKAWEATVATREFSPTLACSTEVVEHVETMSKAGTGSCTQAGRPRKATRIKPQSTMCSLCPSTSLRLLVLPSNYLFYVNCDDYSWLLTWLHIELTKTQNCSPYCKGFFFFKLNHLKWEDPLLWIFETGNYTLIQIFWGGKIHL